MAATVRKSSVAAILLLASLFAPSASSDQASDIRTVLEHVTTGLVDGNPADAMKPFDSAFRSYDKLRDYFDGLTNGYQLTNEVNVVDERDASDQVELTVNWTITLGHLTNPGVQNTRQSKIQIRMVRKKHGWKIVEFSPIDLFNPQFRPPSGNNPR